MKHPGKAAWRELERQIDDKVLRVHAPDLEINFTFHGDHTDLAKVEQWARDLRSHLCVEAENYVADVPPPIPTEIEITNFRGVFK